MIYAIDTNVLARTVHKNHPMQKTAIDSIDNLIDRGETVCVLAQSLYELWVILTRPLNVNGFGMSAAEAQAKLADFESFLILKTD